MAHLDTQPKSRSTGMRLARRVLFVGALIGAWSTLLTGCESQVPYAECALDQEVTSKGVCKGGSTNVTGTTSCVVTRHPHCVQSVCLSYYSTTPVCTHGCTADADCEQNGWCWAFSPTQKYCVPSDRKSELGT